MKTENIDYPQEQEECYNLTHRAGYNVNVTGQEQWRSQVEFIYQFMVVLNNSELECMERVVRAVFRRAEIIQSTHRSQRVN